MVAQSSELAPLAAGLVVVQPAAAGLGRFQGRGRSGLEARRQSCLASGVVFLSTVLPSRSPGFRGLCYNQRWTEGGGASAATPHCSTYWPGACQSKAPCDGEGVSRLSFLGPEGQMDVVLWDIFLTPFVG